MEGKLVTCLTLVVVLQSMVVSVRADGAACAEKIINQKLVDYGAAYNNSDEEGVAKIFSKCAILMLPGQPLIKGRENVAAALIARQNDNDDAIVVTNVATIILEDTAMFLNTFVRTDLEGNVIEEGKGVNVWRLIDDRWLMEWLIFNNDNPCPTCPTPMPPY